MRRQSGALRRSRHNQTSPAAWRSRTPQKGAKSLVQLYAEKKPDGLVFIGPKGGRLRGSRFHKLWKKALRAAGVDVSTHLHDLRHTGNTLTAASGASLKELMARMGHASTRAALIYQHATRERDREIADPLNSRITKARGG